MSIWIKRSNSTNLYAVKVPLLVQVYFQTLLTSEKCVSRAHYDVSCVATSNQNCWRQIVKSNEIAHTQTIPHACSLLDWLTDSAHTTPNRIPFIKITKCTGNGRERKSVSASTCIEISNVSLCFCATITIKYHDLPFYFFYFILMVTSKYATTISLSLSIY